MTEPNEEAPSFELSVEITDPRKVRKPGTLPQYTWYVAPGMNRRGCLGTGFLPCANGTT